MNLYDGRAAFPDSVHKSWQTGTFDEVKSSVISYIDSMITGINKDIEKYDEEGNTEKVNLEKDKLSRVNNLKEKLEFGY